MKAVLVGIIGAEKKLYYIIDTENKNSDGVVDDGKNPKIVNFWKTAIRQNSLQPIKTTAFHRLLWDGPEDGNRSRWERIFVNKTQNIDKMLLSGVVIVSDVLKSTNKTKSLNERASEFKTLMQTQNVEIVRNRAGRQ